MYGIIEILGQCEKLVENELDRLSGLVDRLSPFLQPREAFLVRGKASQIHTGRYSMPYFFFFLKKKKYGIVYHSHLWDPSHVFVRPN